MTSLPSACDPFMNASYILFEHAKVANFTTELFHFSRNNERMFVEVFSV